MAAIRHFWNYFINETKKSVVYCKRKPCQTTRFTFATIDEWEVGGVRKNNGIRCCS